MRHNLIGLVIVALALGVSGCFVMHSAETRGGVGRGDAAASAPAQTQYAVRFERVVSRAESAVALDGASASRGESAGAGFALTLESASVEIVAAAFAVGVALGWMLEWRWRDAV